MVHPVFSENTSSGGYILHSSFDCLKIVDDVQHPTFQAACRAQHLLDDDHQWDDALNEAYISDSPHRLRHLFSAMLIFCSLSNATELWRKYKNNLAEDYFRDIHRVTAGVVNDIQREDVLNRCLNEIQHIVLSIGGETLSGYGLPEPVSNEERGSEEYSSETNYDSIELSNILP
ncbi:putative DNA helicase [Danaus plexippus plexippus]|uniref:DNA helicase n=1 Tax=Danaus plexippus plexippus TaxID=278856 RepID=A0A212EHN5_DANPL|nr:putative DNA helicase [Danaus plexippus plexippus]